MSHTSPDSLQENKLEPEQNQKAPNGLGLLAEVTNLAWDLVIPIVGGVLLGHFIDKRTGEQFTWTISLLALGVMIAFGNLYNLYREHGRQQKSHAEEQTIDEAKRHEES
jgi:F0F1-type ATP synthase assembly protein I